MKHADRTSVSARTVFADPVHFLAFGFGVGLLPKAPGTAGSVLGLLVAWLTFSIGLPWRIAIAGALIIIGIWICGESAKRLGTHDYRGIVWDEIAGMYVTLLAVPRELIFWAIGFALFRIFDIWKPWPIRDLDSTVAGGLGIMIDDLLASIFAILLLLLAGILIG